MPVFEKLKLWVDPVSRSGPETMAVDEWLLETAACPVLRVYAWAGDWGSIGYFGKIAEAREVFPGLDLVRRWTGGGMVDHRADWTYTLAVPAGEPLAGLRGAESYRQIHEILMRALEDEHLEALISDGERATGATLCFENPVGHDLLGVDGRKLAGAGQRRSKSGLLHQGSVAVETISNARAVNFATRLSRTWEEMVRFPDSEDLGARIHARYARDEWMNRR
ncbi:MAG: hypothetical protein V4689_11085 [Verrucomicrobiota bacterium]